MLNITETLKESFVDDEVLIDECQMFFEEENCEYKLYLSSKRLFLYKKLPDNEDIEYFLLNSITSLKKIEDTLVIGGIRDSESHFSYLTETFAIESFIEKLSHLTTPLIEEIAQKKIRQEKEVNQKKIKKILSIVLSLLLIGGMSAGGVYSIVYFTEQQKIKEEEARIKKEQSRIAAINKLIQDSENQIKFMESYEDRVNVYCDFLSDIEKEISRIDISSKKTNWKTLLNDFNQYSNKYKEIKISEEEIKDYNIAINKKEGYIQNATIIANQNIETILKSISENIPNKFSKDPALLPTTKNICKDTKILLDELKKDMQKESELIEKSILELKKEL